MVHATGHLLYQIIQLLFLQWRRLLNCLEYVLACLLHEVLDDLFAEVVVGGKHEGLHYLAELHYQLGNQLQLQQVLVLRQFVILHFADVNQIL